jgi:hypothetical protein
VFLGLFPTCFEVCAELFDRRWLVCAQVGGLGIGQAVVVEFGGAIFMQDQAVVLSADGLRFVIISDGAVSCITVAPSEQCVALGAAGGRVGVVMIKCAALGCDSVDVWQMNIVGSKALELRA